MSATSKPNYRNPARILIVDDHPIVRRGLRALMSHEEDLEVCGEAEDISQALAQLDDEPPDLALIDISLKDGNGLDLIKRIKARDGRVKMLVSSMHDESLFAERALRAGAMGYINKQEAPEKVIEAIRQVLGGKMYFSLTVTDRLLRRVAEGQPPAERQPLDALSDREVEVFQLIGQGRSTREIAHHLHLSIKTIESHRENIKSKLRLRSAGELSRHAVQWVLENG